MSDLLRTFLLPSRARLPLLVHWLTTAYSRVTVFMFWDMDNTLGQSSAGFVIDPACDREQHCARPRIHKLFTQNHHLLLLSNGFVVAVVCAPLLGYGFMWSVISDG